MSKHARMNRIYRLLWSAVTGAWVAVAETAKGCGSRSARKRRVPAALLWLAALAVQAQTPPPAQQLPTGGQVVAGQAGISQTGARLDITQSSDRAVVNWNTFNVGAQGQVNFQQPHAGAVTLNRVLDSNPSQIMGRITANGQVFLSNPNGIVFGPTASVNVGGLVATTHDINTADFMAGKNEFERKGSTGKVVNEGGLEAKLGGYIALLAPEVRNSGIVIAQMGTAALASGERITLHMAGSNTLAGISVTPAQIQALVENRNLVSAPGGLVLMSAQAANALLGGVVKNSGRIEATGMALRGGKIVLEASGQIDNSGSIRADARSGADVSGPETGGPAGSIQLSAPQVLNSGEISAVGTAAFPAATSSAAVAASDAVAAAQASIVNGGRIQITATDISQSASGHLNVSTLGGTAGSIQLDATRDIDMAGHILAEAPAASATHTGSDAAVEQGGRITLQAGRNITLRSITVSAAGNWAGGDIRIAGGHEPLPGDDPAAPAPRVAILGSSSLSTSSRRGRGGRLTMTGEQVDLEDHSTLVATGGTGGGEILIGGGWQGRDPTIRHARWVTIAQGVSLDASATGRGDGGTLVAWSELGDAASLTRAFGSFRARGGEQGGNGGRIETSGHTVDTDGARVNAGADAGKGGLWLIDPTDATINQAIATGYETTLNTGTSVTNTVTGDIATSGTVTLTKSAGGDATLTLQATGSINLSSLTISSSSNKLHVVLHVDSAAANQTGALAAPTNVYMNGVSITTNGGDFLAGGGADPATGYAVGYGPVSLATIVQYAPVRYGVRLDTTTINAGGGNITLRGRTTSGQTSNGIDLGYISSTSAALTTTSAGTVNVVGDAYTSGAYYGMEIGGNTTINGGTINLTGSSASPFNPIRVYGGAGIGNTTGQSITFNSLYTGSGSTGWTVIFGTISGSAATVGNTSNTTLIDFIVDKSGTSGSYGAVHATATGVSFFGNSATLKIRPGDSYLTRGQTLGGTSDGGSTWTQLLGTAASNSNLSGILPALTGATGLSEIQIGRSDVTGTTTVNATSSALNQNTQLIGGSGTMTIAGAFSTGTGALTLTSSGSITESGSGSITATTLNATLGSSGALTLAQSNTITNLGAITAPGGINIANGNNSLTVTGNLSTTNSALTLSAGSGTLTLNNGITLSSGSGSITLTADTPTFNSCTLTSTGSLTVQSSSTSFAGSFSFPGNLSIGSTLGGLTLGKTTNTANVTLGSATSIAGAINVYGGDIAVNENLTSTGSSTAILLKATGDIVLAASKAITSSNGAITFWSDSDASGSGAIKLNSGSSVSSSGGAITLSGGSALATGYAQGSATYVDGIFIDRASLSAGGGSVSLRGQGYATTGGHGVYLAGSGTADSALLSSTSGNLTVVGIGTGATSHHGVFLDAGASIKTTGGGNIAITGQGSLSGTASNNEGVKLDNSSLVEIQSGTGKTLDITGTGGTGVDYNIGVNVRGSSTVRLAAGVTGQMTITGTGGTCSNTGCWGVLAEGSGVYTSLGAGSIAITGVGGTGSDNVGINVNGSANPFGSASMSGDITLTANSLTLSGSIRSTGALTVKPSTASTSIGVAGGTGTLSLPASLFASTFVDGFSSITIGSSATTGAISIGTSALSWNDPLLLKTTSSISVTSGASLTGNGNALVLNADTDSNGGRVTFASNSSVSTGGGNLIMGGGTCTTTSCTTAAISDGSAGSAGVALDGSSGNLVSLSTGGGLLYAWSRGGTAGGVGFYANYASLDTGSSGSMTLRGDGVWTGSSNGHGLVVDNSTLIGGSGGMTLNANAGANSAGQFNYALVENSASTIYTTNGGAMTLNLSSNTPSNAGSGTFLFGVGTLGHSTLQNGNITITSSGSSTATLDMPIIQIPTGSLSVTGIRNVGVNNTINVPSGNVTLAAGSGFTVSSGSSTNLTASGLLLSGTNATHTLNQGSYSVTTLAANTGTVNFVQSGTVTVGTVSSTDGVTASSNITVQVSGASSDVILNKPVTTTSGTINIAAGQNFTNNNASGTGLVAGSGRYLVYSSNPTDTLEGMSGYSKHYNQTYTAGSTPSYASSGNWFLYTLAPTLTLSSTASTMIYGDSLSALSPTLTGYIDGDTSAGLSGTASYTVGGSVSSSGNPTVGSHTLTYNSGLSSSLGYQISASSGTLTVSTKTVNVSGLTVANKTYDGTTTASVSGSGSLTSGGTLSSDGKLLTGDSVSVSGSASGVFASANAGTHSVTVTGLSLSGTDAANYTLGSATGSGTIQKATLSVQAQSLSKIFDGQAFSGGNGVAYSGFVNGETSAVLGGTLSYSGTSQGAVNVGNYVITPGGLSSSNYDFTYSSGTLSIGAAPLTLRSVSGSIIGNPSKTYDGTTVATLNSSQFTLSGFVGTDGATITKTTGTYDSADAGSRTVSVSLSSSDYAPLSGTNLSNYILPTSLSGSGTINKAALTVTAINATKVFDSKPYSGGNGVAFSGLVNGETASVLGGRLSYSGSSQGAVNAGSYVITPGGYTASNYSLSYVNGSLSITPATLKVVAASITGNPSKTYDGSTTATLTSANYSLSGFVGSDSAIVFKTTGSYDSPNAGSRTITVNLSPADFVPVGNTLLANYALPTVATGPGTINKASLTVTANDASKIFNNQPFIGGNGVRYSGFVNGETASVLGGSLSFTGSSQGAVNAGSYVITPGGLSSGNYNLAYANGTLTVNPATLRVVTATISGNPSKTYDGSTNATLTSANYSLSGFVGSDGATVTKTTGSYDSANAGNRTVTVSLAPSDFRASGSTLLSNYTLPTVASGAGTINKANLSIIANDFSKPFDGQAFSGGNGVRISGFVNGESTSVLGGSLVYTGSAQGAVEAGNYGITPGGYTAANYTLSFVGGLLTIQPRPNTGTNPGTGTPPVTTPPVTEPPVTTPPVTTPPVTEPPVTTPPVTTPPVTTPPVTTPPVTEPPTTTPPVTTPPVTTPPVTIPPVTEPPVTTPPVTTPPVTEPPITTPPVTEPPTTPPVNTAPIIVPPIVVPPAFTPPLPSLPTNPGPAAVPAPGLPVSAAPPGASPDLVAPATPSLASASPATVTPATVTPATPSADTSPATGPSPVSSEAAVASGGSTALPVPTTSTAPAASSPESAASSRAVSGLSTAPSVVTAASTGGSRAGGNGGRGGGGGGGGNGNGNGNGVQPGMGGAREAEGSVSGPGANGGGTLSLSAPGDGPLADATPPPVSPANTPLPAPVAAAQNTLASGNAPASGLDALAGGQVGAALARGVPAEQAAQAGNAFSQTLLLNLSRGVPISEATQLAQKAFDAETGLAAPRTPQQVAARGLVSGSADVDKQLTALSGAQTSRGLTAFDRVLGAALARGLSFNDALQAAQTAVAQSEGKGGNDRSASSTLANGNTDTGPLANAPPAFQRTLSALLAKGLPVDMALKRAEQAARDQAASRGEGNSLGADLASGDFSFLERFPVDGAFSKVFGTALARGSAIPDALNRATALDVQERQLLQADARSELRGFAAGNGTLPASDADFDRALSNALIRGASPTAALASARKAASGACRTANVVTENNCANRTPSSVLASGQLPAALQESAGYSRAFRLSLGNALAKGVPLEQAITRAKRAEEANALRFAMPPQMAKLLAANDRSVQVTTSTGKPLPGWLRFGGGAFKAYDVPEGGLPIQVVVVSGNQRMTMQIADNGGRP